MCRRPRAWRQILRRRTQAISHEGPDMEKCFCLQPVSPRFEGAGRMLSPRPALNKKLKTGLCFGINFDFSAFLVAEFVQKSFSKGLKHNSEDLYIIIASEEGQALALQVCICVSCHGQVFLPNVDLLSRGRCIGLLPPMRGGQVSWWYFRPMGRRPNWIDFREHGRTPEAPRCVSSTLEAFPRTRSKMFLL